jgi:hypothetical protein
MFPRIVVVIQTLVVIPVLGRVVVTMDLITLVWMEFLVCLNVVINMLAKTTMNVLARRRLFVLASYATDFLGIMVAILLTK